MFEKRILSEIGYLETSLPVRPFLEMTNNIILNGFEHKHNSNLAGQIEKEYRMESKMIPNEIKKVIISGCHEYIKTFGHTKFDFLHSKYNLKPHSAWVNFQKSGEYNPIHNHSGDLVFVIWIQIPYNLEDELNLPNSIKSNTNVASCFQFANVSSRFSNICRNVISVDKSYEGKMIIFHSAMEHTVYPFFTSKDYRISMSGNLEIVFEE